MDSGAIVADPALAAVLRTAIAAFVRAIDDGPQTPAPSR